MIPITIGHWQFGTTLLNCYMEKQLAIRLSCMFEISSPHLIVALTQYIWSCISIFDWPCMQELLSVHARQLQGEEAHRKIGRRPANGDYDIRGTTCTFAVTWRRRDANFFTDELLVVASTAPNCQYMCVCMTPYECMTKNPLSHEIGATEVVYDSCNIHYQNQDVFYFFLITGAFRFYLRGQCGSLHVHV